MIGSLNIKGGIDTSDATAVVADILTGKTAYVNKQKLTGTMPNRGSKAFTPSNATQTSGAGYYNSITCNAVSNLIASNIKQGATVGGVAGNYTSDATASANDIKEGKTAYVNGNKLTGTSNAVDINGIIEEYTVASGGNVNAGDFVEFINNYGAGKDTQLSTVGGSGATRSAVALSGNRIFIAHSSDTTNYYLNGMVCTINGTTISKGTDTQLSTVSGSGYTISAVLLSENKVFIAHSRDNTRDNSYLNGMICTINGTSITKGTDTQLSTERYSGYRIPSAVALSETKVFIAHSWNIAGLYLNGIVCTINGTTITAGTDTELSSETWSSDYVSAVALSKTKVFIAHSSDRNNEYLNGMICTINGTSITKETDTQLSSETWSSDDVSAVALSETKVFIAHSRTTNLYLNGMICTINGTSITKETDTQLSTDSGSSDRLSAVLLSENRVFIAHSGGGPNYYLNGMICTINGTTITVETDKELITGSYSSFAVLNDNNIFIAHGSKLTGMIGGKDITKSSENINGIAKTSATAGNIAQVYVPN